MDHAAGYRVAFSDWLACAAAGFGEPPAAAAAGAGDGLLDRVAAAGAAGHVLDFDDTYPPGLAHLSAATAPAALILGSELGARLGRVLDAFEHGFEAMGAMARAAHPALYHGGWHPTAVCGSAGAAAVASRLLELGPEAERSAVALGLLRAGGIRSGFGSAGKSIGVGLAAATGVAAARMAAAGARADLESILAGAAGFERVFAADLTAADRTDRPAVAGNWIKAYPCCLQTHGAIEAAVAAGESGVSKSQAGARGIEVLVHPLSLQAAPVRRPRDGLEAKFSIPYLTAFALLAGAPGREDFADLDAGALDLAESVAVHADGSLGESEAVLALGGEEVSRVLAARGSPRRPLRPAELAAKQVDLTGEDVSLRLGDPSAPAAGLERWLTEARESA
ncbi:MAG: MmgE/PrpD family protein [Solirubrobacterales bacterium]